MLALSLIPVSCVLEVFDDNSGGWQISRHRWAVLINWIHPWQPKIDVTIVILALTSCTVAAVLQCIQWIINSCSSVEVKRFQRRFIPCWQWPATASCGNRALLVRGKARRWRNIYDLPVKMMTGTFIIADRLEICRSFHPKKTPTIWTGGGDMRQANSNHHQQEILLQIVTNTVENEFERCLLQSIITLVAEVGWAANANVGINKYSWKMWQILVKYTGPAELRNWWCPSGSCSVATNSCMRGPSIEKWLSIPGPFQ